MPNIDVSNVNNLSTQHIKLIYAIDAAMKTHEYAPLTVINRIARIQSIKSVMGDLQRFDLVSHVGGSCDGYKLTYQGFDYLAFKIL